MREAAGWGNVGSERSLEEAGSDRLWRGRIREIVLLFERCVRIHQEDENR